MSEDIVVTPKAMPTVIDQTATYDNIHPIAGLLGLDTHHLSDTDTEQLSKIYDFIRGDAKEMNDIELLHQVRQIEQKLGMTNLGERRIDKLYRYVKLQSQIDNLSKVRDRELR